MVSFSPPVTQSAAVASLFLSVATRHSATVDRWSVPPAYQGNSVAVGIIVFVSAGQGVGVQGTGVSVGAAVLPMVGRGINGGVGTGVLVGSDVDVSATVGVSVGQGVDVGISVGASFFVGCPSNHAVTVGRGVGVAVAVDVIITMPPAIGRILTGRRGSLVAR